MTRANNRIVILGAAGFIGYHISVYLLKMTQCQLVLVDNFTRGQKDKLFDTLVSEKNVVFKNLDLSHEKSYIDLFEEEDLVINCAALNGTQNFYSKPVDVIRNSAIPAILTPEYAARASVSKYIYFGSSESYAGGINLGITPIPTPETVPLIVDDITNSRWSYAISKTIGETAAIANHNQFGLNYLILRIHNIYGPRMGNNHVIPDLIHKFTKGDADVYGINETRCFMYIDDLVNIVFDLATNSDIKSNAIYNIGSETETQIVKLAELILEELNLNLNIYSSKSFPGSVLRRHPDSSSLRSQINFVETDLKVGLKKTIDWYLNNTK
jgi:nucleoside-diphosphate-sugar epimerase